MGMVEYTEKKNLQILRSWALEFGQGQSHYSHKCNSFLDQIGSLDDFTRRAMLSDLTRMYGRVFFKALLQHLDKGGRFDFTEMRQSQLTAEKALYTVYDNLREARKNAARKPESPS